jgi:hypothetical protein
MVDVAHPSEYPEQLCESVRPLLGAVPNLKVLRQVESAANADTHDAAALQSR